MLQTTELNFDAALARFPQIFCDMNPEIFAEATRLSPRHPRSEMQWAEPVELARLYPEYDPAAAQGVLNTGYMRGWFS